MVTGRGNKSRQHLVMNAGSAIVFIVSTCTIRSDGTSVFKGSTSKVIGTLDNKIVDTIGNAILDITGVRDEAEDVEDILDPTND